LHAASRAAGAPRGKSFSAAPRTAPSKNAPVTAARGLFLLGGAARARLRGGVLIALLARTAPMLDSLADYPRWFVVACGTIVAAVLIWVVMKLLKLALWLLIAGVLVVGLGTAAWLLIR
jgi:hypothetical protein